MTGRASEPSGRWGRATALPMTLLAVVFALTFLTQLGTGSEDVGQVARWTRVVVWLAFGVDYVVRVRLSPHPVRFVLTHPLDLVVVAVPLLRPVLDLLGGLVRRRQALRGQANVVRRTLVYLVSVASTLVLFVAVAALLAERDAPGATIRTFPDALWWAVVTVTTVGYGDLYPVAVAGRTAAVLGMLLGIGVLGTVTATISAQVVASARADVAAGTDAAARTGAAVPAEEESLALVDLPQVLAEVRALRREVAALRADATAPPDGPGRPGEARAPDDPSPSGGRGPEG